MAITAVGRRHCQLMMSPSPTAKKTTARMRLPVTGYSTGTFAAFGAMALISQVIGHSSYNWGLKWFSAGLIAVTWLGEPILSTILAYFLFGEGLTL